MTIYNMAINATINTNPTLKKFFTKVPIRRLMHFKGEHEQVSIDWEDGNLHAFQVWAVPPDLDLTTEESYRGSNSLQVKWNKISNTYSDGGFGIGIVFFMATLDHGNFEIWIKGSTTFKCTMSLTGSVGINSIDITITPEWTKYTMSGVNPARGGYETLYFWGPSALETMYLDCYRVYPDDADNYPILGRTNLKQISAKITSKLSFERFLTIGLETSQTLKARMNTLRGKTLYGLVCIDVKESLLVLKQLHANLKGLTTEHTLNLRTLKAETALNATVSIYQYFLKKFYQVKIQTSKHYKVGIEKVKQFKVKVEGRLK